MEINEQDWQAQLDQALTDLQQAMAFNDNKLLVIGCSTRKSTAERLARRVRLMWRRCCSEPLKLGMNVQASISPFNAVNI